MYDSYVRYSITTLYKCLMSKYLTTLLSVVLQAASCSMYYVPSLSNTLCTTSSIASDDIHVRSHCTTGDAQLALLCTACILYATVWNDICAAVCAGVCINAFQCPSITVLSYVCSSVVCHDSYYLRHAASV
jgi:hypothetical protein